VLVEPFSQLVGVSPMLYLARWRLQLAAEQLLRGSAKIAAIGAQVGYESRRCVQSGVEEGIRDVIGGVATGSQRRVT
jgi:methylphosphotriester-DNA--protein-cysteine methyltransferase